MFEGTSLDNRNSAKAERLDLRFSNLFDSDSKTHNYKPLKCIIVSIPERASSRCPNAPNLRGNILYFAFLLNALT
jgi:hypothetical protein